MCKHTHTHTHTHTHKLYIYIHTYIHKLYILSLSLSLSLSLTHTHTHTHKHSLADTLSASLAIRETVNPKIHEVEASENVSPTDVAARAGAPGTSIGAHGFRPSVSCTTDVVLMLVAGLVVGQAKGSPQVARQALCTLQGMLVHVTALGAGQEKRGNDGEFIFEGFTCTSLDLFMDLLADLAKTAPAVDLRREAADSLVDLALLRGRIRHALRAPIFKSPLYTVTLI
jgi:hypothetical protein